MEASKAAVWRSLERLAIAACLAFLLVESLGRSPGAAIQRLKRGPAPPDCLLATLQGGWQLAAGGQRPLELALPHVAVTSPALLYNKEKLGVAWRWEAAATACGARRRSTAELARALRGKRVHFVGDSHSVRFGNWLFARLAGLPPPTSPKNVTFTPGLLPGGIVMRKNMTNVAAMLKDTLLSLQDWPDVLVLSAAAWHLKFNHSVSRYRQELEGVRRVLQAWSPPGMLLFWITPPLQSTLRSPPRGDVQREWAPVYARVAQDLGFFHPAGPAHHLDFQRLSTDCLPWCVRDNDGLHASDTLLELAEQLFANVLATAWQQGGAAAQRGQQEQRQGRQQTEETMQ